MILRSLLFISLVQCIFSDAGAQTLKGLTFTGLNRDYGRVESWTGRIDTITVRNNSQEEVSFLPTVRHKSFEMKLPEKPVLPGESAHILYIFTPQQAGKFYEKTAIYHSASAQPVYLKAEGEIISFSPTASIDCPTFKKEPATVQEPATASSGMKQIATPHRGEEMSFEDNEALQNKGEELPRSLFKPNNIVFLIDVSNSMKDSNKLPYLKESMTMLLSSLRDIDRITIVTYADKARMMLPATSAENKEAIAEVIHSLTARGGTSANNGLKMAYAAAFDNFIKDGNNIVYMATDGRFEASGDSETKLNLYVKMQSFRGVNLSVIGFGEHQKSIDMLSGLAEKGGGRFVHISSEDSVNEALLTDVKLSSRK